MPTPPWKSTYVDQETPGDIMHDHEVPNKAQLMEMQRPANKRSHICCYCFKSFANNSNLQRHVRTRCKYRCAEVLPNGTGVVKHNSPVQDVSCEMLVCDRCSKGFSRKADFNRHIDLEHRHGQTSHSCYLCPEAFDDASSLQTHLNAHMSDSNKLHVDSLKRESDEQHDDCLPEPQYSCNICSIMFADEYVLAEHVLIAHSLELLCMDKKPLFNKHCADECEVMDDFDNTVHELLAMPSHDCNLCAETFKEASGLAEHIENNHPRASCSLDKQQENNANHHEGTSATMATRQVKKPITPIHHACHLCPEGFAKGTTLLQHVHIVHGAVTKHLDTKFPGSSKQSNFKEAHFCEAITPIHHACHLCPEGFAEGTTLQLHVRTVHAAVTKHLDTKFSGSSKQSNFKEAHFCKAITPIHHACHLCPEGFAEGTTLQQHVRTVHGAVTKHLDTKFLGSTKQSKFKKTHICDQCSKSFRSKGHLTRHQMTHTLSRPFACHLCPGTFTQKGILKRHIQRHSGLKRFSCPHCSKGFLIKAELHIHMRTHTGERPYVCEVCSAAFSARDNLRKHEATHTGLRPFACPQCPRSFIRSQTLKRHLRRHTGERPFACTMCPRKFTRRNLLREHTEAVHQVRTPAT
ncbi:uncharacterized protein LOC119179315 [Rhipicephalus microplus]|uniref:uncharacterized protein LOC119179315 n=1 Tax=Rhipicephalus microplus TaxID=6941 RepID=UPI003F6D763C